MFSLFLPAGVFLEECLHSCQGCNIRSQVSLSIVVLDMVALDKLFDGNHADNLRRRCLLARSSHSCRKKVARGQPWGHSKGGGVTEVVALMVAQAKFITSAYKVA